MSVDADIPASEDLLGKTADDLQEDIVVYPDKITGTLKYVTGYTGFSGSVELQSGNFLALHCEATNADYITVELLGGASEGHPITLDETGMIVGRITDASTQKVKIRAHKGSDVETRTFDLSDLTLAV